jgi:hypothetical protein
MRIIKENKLIEKINSYNLSFCEVKSFNLSNSIHLKLSDVEAFLKFVKDNDFKVIYYLYKYYKSEDYFIPFDWYSEETKDFKIDVEKHNAQVKEINFNLPKSLSLFTLHHGVFSGVEFADFWMENNEKLSVADDAIETIENKFYGEEDKFKKTNREDRKRDEKELREIIINDPEFKYCKNQDIRYWYLADLLEAKEMNKYKYLFKPHFGIAQSGKAKVFMDKTWMIYNEK